MVILIEFEPISIAAATDGRFFDDLPRANLGFSFPSPRVLCETVYGLDGLTRWPAVSTETTANNCYSEGSLTTAMHERDPQSRTRELLTAGATAELRLLKEERKAERRLSDALATLRSDEARLRKIRERVERSREAVAAAEAKLREHQTRRATGPLQSQD